MGFLKKISGPVVVADGMTGSTINELVRIGEQKLIGEIIALNGDDASIQVYEETAGLKPGEKVVSTGLPLSVELGPGLLSSVFDGTQRPLEKIRAASGDFIARGIDVPSLDRKAVWKFEPNVKNGENVSEGQVLGTVKEKNIEHRIMVPVGVSGKVSGISEGNYKVTDVVCTVGKTDITMLQKWPVRKPRKSASKKDIEPPLITGKRIFDTLFPMAKGGAACIPGPFGSGKTVTQTDLAKYCDADIIVYIGCGERGNEMTEVLTEFPHLSDPRTGKHLMDRTILVANTSNMPVAAREASIYTGITLAEYYRDMGYDVALMADSTSRWAEALREISGRMEEMPGEEGYPAYLARKLAEFYERAGRIVCLGSGGKREGSISVIGAISPAGGDTSEPVSQGTFRITKIFWALDSSLSRRRHYPAINWLKSYSLYAEMLAKWFEKNVAEDYCTQRVEAMGLLQKEAELQNIVQLIGPDALPDRERMILEVTKMLREDFLQQNSYDEVDAYSSLKKQYLMLKTILHFYHKANRAIDAEVPLAKIISSPAKGLISKLKRVPEKEIDAKVKEAVASIDSTLSSA
ncbi:MAG: V-type ATP synthase subunit A [Candidatus Micrarchaeia archaeon]|jgi:V/A-type H+-transporting ATPase subunit A